MPGTFVVKPIEATLNGAVTLGTYSRSLDPYCEVKIGRNCVYSNPSKELGPHPHWDEDLIIQQGNDSKAKVILKDQNLANPSRDIGEATLDLNQITAKGHVCKWFDITKGHRKQGKILLDVTYTEANPQSRTFHNSINVGTAIKGNSQDQIYHDIETHSHVDPEYRRKFLEATKDPFKHRAHHAHTPEHDKVIVKDFSEHKKSRKLYEGADPTLANTKVKPGTANTGMSNPNTMKLGVNHHHPAENIPVDSIPLKPDAHTHHVSFAQNPEVHKYNPNARVYHEEIGKKCDHHCTAHHHHSYPQHTGKNLVELPEGPTKGPWDARDPTIRNTPVRPGTANSGMSNPNTMKLGVNHYDVPTGHAYDENVPERVDPHPRLHHSGRKVDLPEGPTKGPWEVRDPTIRNTRVKPGSSNSGMSNPNTMKLGVNHDLPNDHVHYDEIPERVDPHPRIHHSGRKVELPEGPTKGPWEVRDPTIRNTTVRPGTANTGMSNPNTMKLGVNHHYPAENIPVDDIDLRPNVHYHDVESPVEPPPEVARHHPNVHYHNVETPVGPPREVVENHPSYSGRNKTNAAVNQPAKKFWQAKDPTIKNTRVKPGSANSGMSNPNTAKLGVNHDGYADHLRTDNVPLVADSQPRGRYNRKQMVDEPEEVYDAPERHYTAVRPHASNTGMSNPNTANRSVNHHIEHDEHQRFSPVVDTITDAAPRGRYSRKAIDEVPESHVQNNIRDPTLKNTTVKPYSSNTGMSNPNTAKLGVNKGPVYYDPNAAPVENYVVMDRPGSARDRHNQAFEPVTGHVNHGAYEPAYGPEDLADTGMSNPNIAGLDYQRLRGMKNAQEMLANQRRVQGLQECAHPHAFEIDKITKSNDTSLGCYRHPEHLDENGMSDPNNARYGINHHIERPSTGGSRRGYTGYTTAEHTNCNEVDKITRVNDTTLGRQRDLEHVWESGMSDPNAILKGVNHADVRRKESWESRGSLVKKDVGPYEVDKITSVHDIRLSKNKRLY